MRKTRKCAFCGREFAVNSGMQKYCCEKCAAEAKRERKKRTQNFMNAVEPLAELQGQEYFTFSKAAVLMGCTRRALKKQSLFRNLCIRPENPRSDNSLSGDLADLAVLMELWPHGLIRTSNSRIRPCLKAMWRFPVSSTGGSF